MTARLAQGAAMVSESAPATRALRINAQGRSAWHLWLPARLGPPRNVKRKLIGQSVATTVKRRKLELPPSANDRTHWRDKAPWVAGWRSCAKDSAKAAHIPPQDRIRVSAVVCRRTLGIADEDNDRSRLKPILDGLRDAKVIANDTRGYVEWGSVTEQRCGSDGPGILLIIEPAASSERET